MEAMLAESVESSSDEDRKADDEPEDVEWIVKVEAKLLDLLHAERDGFRNRLRAKEHALERLCRQVSIRQPQAKRLTAKTKIPMHVLKMKKGFACPFCPTYAVTADKNARRYMLRHIDHVHWCNYSYRLPQGGM